MGARKRSGLGCVHQPVVTFGPHVTLVVAESLSHAEVDHAGLDAVKDAILNDRKTVAAESLVKALKERRHSHDR